MRYAFLILLAALGFFPTIAEAEYIPIAVGDEWTMAMNVVSPAGQSSDGLFRRRIESADAKDGKAYVRERTWTVGLAKRTESTKLLRKDVNGVYSIDESVAGAVEQMEVVLPLKVGATWQQTEGAKTMTNTVIGLESIEVAGKTYENCYHIRISSSDGTYTEDFWEAPRVGNVKSIIAYGSGLKITLTIQEFKSGD
jgi:hypothetical protein